MNDTVARDHISLDDLCTVHSYAISGRKRYRLTLNRGNFAVGYVSGHDLIRNDVVGQDLGQNVFVLWEQQCVKNACGQYCAK